jgi:hypothetical protein
VPDPILDYRNPTRSERKRSSIGAVSFALSLSVLLFFFIPVPVPAVLMIPVIAVIVGIHAEIESRGRSIFGWLGIGISCLWFALFAGIWTMI